VDVTSYFKGRQKMEVIGNGVRPCARPISMRRDFGFQYFDFDMEKTKNVIPLAARPNQGGSVSFIHLRWQLRYPGVAITPVPVESNTQIMVEALPANAEVKLWKSALNPRPICPTRG